MKFSLSICDLFHPNMKVLRSNSQLVKIQRSNPTTIKFLQLENNPDQNIRFNCQTCGGLT